MDNRLHAQLDFLLEIDKMKTILRQTVLVDKSRRENDAEHSWHFALMAITLFEYCELEGVNLDRVVKMALVHDLVEIYAGDTFAYDEEGTKDKEARERASADKIFSMLPKEQGSEFRLLWEEFDQMKTPDALYASAIDRFQPFLNNSATGGHTWDKYSVSLSQIYKRMNPVKIATPKLWDFVESTIKESIEQGYIVC